MPHRNRRIQDINNDKVGIIKRVKIRGRRIEKNIVMSFSKHFLVTFSNEVTFKYSEYVFDFLKPTNDFKRKFNLFNEILLLFSRYSEYDARTLDFVDKTLTQYENRLDKICIILISNDEDIERKIINSNSDNKDSRIIVPFTYNELKYNNFNFQNIESKFRRYFYNRDLFALESPLKSEAYFYGRSKIVNDLYGKYTLGEHSGLFGLRKVGKTSVLFALERNMQVRGGKSIYIDCQDTAVHKARWFELLFDIIQNIKDKYGLNSMKTNEEEKYNERHASKCFKRDLEAIKLKLDNEKILLIFDEIEYISFKLSPTDYWKDGDDYISFWQTIRAINQKTEGLFSFIIAGVNPFCIEQSMVNEFDNPIFSLIKPIYLELFDIEDVTLMVKSIGGYMGIHFDKEIFTSLTNDYGGHPFLIRHVCSLINKQIGIKRPYKVSKYEYQARKAEYDNKINNYIKLIMSVLQNWYPKEYELLEILVVEGNEEFKEKVFNVYGIDAANIIEHLFGYGIIEEVNENYYITIDAIKKYIMNQTKLEKKLVNNQEKWATINLRRNKIEGSIKQIIVAVLKSNFGKKTKDEVLKHIPKGRRESLRQFELKEIFDNYLYFSDLKNIINARWKMFEKIFVDKQKFQYFFDYINNKRVDAHNKSISNDDMGILLIAFKWFDEIIDQFI